MSDPTRDAAEFDAQVSRAPQLYTLPGKHRLEVIEIREGVSKNPKTNGQPMYTVNFKVLASDNPSVSVGDRVACVQVRQPRDTTGKYWVKIKSIIAACLARRESEVNHKGYLWAIDAKQPLAGKQCDVRVMVSADGKSNEQFVPATGPAPVQQPGTVAASKPVAAPEREPGSDDGLPF